MGFSRVTAAQGQGRLISVAIGGHMESRVRLSASRRRTFIGEAENVSRGRGHKILWGQDVFYVTGYGPASIITANKNKESNRRRIKYLF